jgi:hypothetical protein
MASSLLNPDECSTCLSDFVPGATAIVCKNMHKLCFDCLGPTIAADQNRPGWHRSGCGLCGEPYLLFDRHHLYPETLPQEFRNEVLADQEAHNLAAAQLLVPPPPPPPPAPVAVVIRNGLLDVREGDRVGKKRTMEELNEALQAVPEAHIRLYKEAARDWNRDNGRLRTRIWRARRTGANEERIQELTDKLAEWNTANPRPRRDEFAPVLAGI